MKGTIGALRAKDEEGRESAFADRDPEYNGRPRLEEDLWARWWGVTTQWYVSNQSNNNKTISMSVVDQSLDAIEHELCSTLSAVSNI